MMVSYDFSRFKKDPQMLVGRTLSVLLKPLSNEVVEQVVTRVTSDWVFTNETKFWLNTGFEVFGTAHATVNAESDATNV